MTGSARGRHQFGVPTASLSEGGLPDFLTRSAVSVENDLKSRSKSNLQSVLTRQRGWRLFWVACVSGFALVFAGVGAAKGPPWWFLRGAHPGSLLAVPVPGSKVMIVRRGAWGSTHWVSTVFDSARYGLCVDLTLTSTAGVPAASATGGSAGGCGPVIGATYVAKPLLSVRAKSVMYFASLGGRRTLPDYIAGSVINKVTNLRIELSNGSVIRTTTYAAQSRVESGLSKGNKVRLPRKSWQRLRNIRKGIDFAQHGEIIAGMRCVSGGAVEAFRIDKIIYPGIHTRQRPIGEIVGLEPAIMDDVLLHFQSELPELSKSAGQVREP